jgi:hypothetical protein
MNDATTTAIAGRKTWHAMDAAAVASDLGVVPERGLGAGEASAARGGPETPNIDDRITARTV